MGPDIWLTLGLTQILLHGLPGRQMDTAGVVQPLSEP